MIEQIRSAPVRPGGQVVVQSAPSVGPEFSAMLDAAGIRLSAHAQKRLQDVSVDSGAAERLSGAVQRAESKGSRESLILVDDLAFVVSVKNKTVITAVDQGRSKENVFTNIDSVVIG